MTIKCEGCRKRYSPREKGVCVAHRNVLYDVHATVEFEIWRRKNNLSGYVRTCSHRCFENVAKRLKNEEIPFLTRQEHEKRYFRPGQYPKIR